MKMMIGGKAVGAADGKTIEVINPATGAVIDTIPAATPADIEHAVAEAVKGQKLWARVPVTQRVDIVLVVQPVAALAARNAGQQSQRFIVSDHARRQAGQARGRADMHGPLHGIRQGLVSHSGSRSRNLPR